MSITATLTRTLLRLAGIFPLPIGRSIGGVAGHIALLFKTRMVSVTTRNIQLCFPAESSQEHQVRIRQSVLETSRLAFEIAAVWTRPSQWALNHIVTVHNRHLVDDALANGQGVLILAPHIGNWEVLGLYLATLGPVTSMYQKPKIAGLDEVIRECREGNGAELVPTDRKGLSKVLSGLRKGHISGILPDQTPKDTNSGRFVSFFNRPAFTMTLAYKLLQKSGAKPVFGYAKRVPKGFEIFFEEAPADMLSEDEAISVQGLSHGIEKCVQAIPDQYQWEYKRFKHQPEGESNPYR